MRGGRRSRSWLLALLLGALAAGSPSASAQHAPKETPSPPRPELPDLGKVKQEEAREKLERLEESMERLARALTASEPQNAAKLRTAFKASRDRLLREGMERIIRYLEAHKLDRAIEDQGHLKAHLQEILDILLEKDIDPRELLKHIRRLRDLVKDLDQVIRDETSEKMASDEAEAAGASAGALAGDLEKLEDLIRREKEIEKKTGDPALASEEALPGLAPEQAKVRDETRSLAEADAARDAAARAPADASGAEPRPGEARPGEDPPPPGEAPAGEPAEPGAPRPGEARPGGGSPAPPRPEPPPARPESVLDRKALARAEKAMEKAEGALKGSERRKASAGAGEARAALEEATGTGRDKLERLRASRDWKALEAEQDRTKTDAERIAEKMKEPPPLVPSPEEGVPGRADVEGASRDMESAARSLGQSSPRKASRKQADSLDKMKLGREKAEETLEELQRALRERVLAYLREKFTKMLNDQRAISRETRSLELKLRALKVARAARGTSSAFSPPAPPEGAPTPAEEASDRKDRQTAEALSAREADMALLADDVIDLLAEDGTTLVFPGIVEEVKGDILNAGSLLSRMETGERTQRIQKEVETALEEILKALENAQRSPPPPNPGQGRSSKSGAGPLLPLSAELKMVRSLQSRVNERTKEFDLGRRPELTPEDKLQLHAIQKKQKDVEGMLRKLKAAAGER